MGLPLAGCPGHGRFAPFSIIVVAPISPTSVRKSIAFLHSAMEDRIIRLFALASIVFSPFVVFMFVGVLAAVYLFVYVTQCCR